MNATLGHKCVRRRGIFDNISVTTKPLVGELRQSQDVFRPAARANFCVEISCWISTDLPKGKERQNVSGHYTTDNLLLAAYYSPRTTGRLLPAPTTGGLHRPLRPPASGRALLAAY